jgi:hypothetical protein
MSINALWLGHRLKMIAGATHGFSRAEKQDPAFMQGKMELGEDSLLSLGAQVDEKVAAPDQVEA